MLDYLLGFLGPLHLFTLTLSNPPTDHGNSHCFTEGKFKKVPCATGSQAE